MTLVPAAAPTPVAVAKVVVAAAPVPADVQADVPEAETPAVDALVVHLAADALQLVVATDAVADAACLAVCEAPDAANQVVVAPVAVVAVLEVAPEAVPAVAARAEAPVVVAAVAVRLVVVDASA